MSAPPDRDACEKNAAPDSNAILEKLFHKERAHLARFLQRRIGDREEASDLVQDIFVRLAKALPSGLSGRPEAYLQRIARNLLVDRSRRRQARRADLHVALDEAAQSAVSPEQCWEIEAADLRRRYEAAVAELPERTRQIYLLHRMEELNYAKMAAHLGITPRVVEYHIAKAVLHLRRTLDSE